MTKESTGVISSSNGAKSVDLNVSDQELEKISRDGIDGNGTLGLSLAAMKAIKDYFKNLVEIHMILNLSLWHRLGLNIVNTIFLLPY